MNKTNSSVVSVTVMVPITIYSNSTTQIPELVRLVKKQKLCVELPYQDGNAVGWFTLDTKSVKLNDIRNRWVDAANRVRRSILARRKALFSPSASNASSAS